MDRTLVLTIAGFLAVAVVVIIAARIQGKRETAARDCFIVMNGWEELRETPAEVQRLLLAHAEGTAWVLDVELIGPWVLVGSHWATGPDEWEHLVRLSRDLADAVGPDHR